MDDKTPESGGAAPGVAGAASRVPSGLSAGVLRYLEARGVLVTIEAQEAFMQVMRCVAFGAVAAVLAFTGWLMIMAALVWWLAHAMQWPWQKVTLAAGGAHVLLALLAFAVMMRRLSSARWFEHTMNEFGKDRAWLARLDDKR